MHITKWKKQTPKSYILYGFLPYGILENIKLPVKRPVIASEREGRVDWIGGAQIFGTAKLFCLLLWACDIMHLLEPRDWYNTKSGPWVC
jgi:hypothetical protein